MIGTLALIGIQIGLMILGRLLAPRVQRPKPQPFDVPKAEAGAVYPVPFGCAPMSFNVMYVREKRGELSDDETHTFYRAKIAGALGWGPLDVIWDIIADEKALTLLKPAFDQSIEGSEPNIITPSLPYEWAEDSDDPAVLAIAALLWFGGPWPAKGEGGMNGEVRIYRGTKDQPMDALTEYALGDLASRYPHLSYICFGQAPGVPTTSPVREDKFIFGTSPTPKSIQILVGRYPRLLLTGNGRIKGVHANPIEVIYECCVNPVWGRKWPASRFDVPQLIEMAQQCVDEGRGISTLLDEQRDVSDFVDDVLSHVRGELVTDPLTGLIQIKLARGDYNVANLLVLDKTNTRNFKQVGKSFSKSLNEVVVNYRRFDPAFTQPVVGEVVTDDFDPWPSIMGNITPLQTSGRYISNVRVYVEGNDPVTPLEELVEGEGFLVNSAKGMIGVHRDFAAEHSTITVDYIPAPTFSGFVDDSAVATSMDHHQIVGRMQSRSYDYPMIADELQAQEMADTLIDMENQDLDVYEWEMNRLGSHLTRVDVVLANEPKYGLSNTAIRITDIDYGSPDNPIIRCKGIKDIFSDRLTFTIPNNDDITPPPDELDIPNIAAIFCMGGSIRMGVQAGDTTFDIVFEVADNPEGTGATEVEGSPFPGTTTFIDDPRPAGSTFYYRAAHTRDGQIGEWTIWVGCTASEDPPDPPPTCIIPSYIIDPDDLEGLVTLAVTDPQNRLLWIEFRHRSGNGPWSPWFTSEAPPYCDAVIPSATECSRIEWQIHYTGCDGLPTVTTGGYDLCPDLPTPDPPPTDPGLNVVDIPVVFHAGGPVPIGLQSVVADVAPMMPWRAGQERTPIIQAKSCYLAMSVSQSNMPVGSYAVIEGEVPGSVGDWGPLDGVDGPKVPLDSASLLELDPEADLAGDLPATVRGISVDIAEGFLSAPLHVRVSTFGGSGSDEEIALVTKLTGWFSVHSVSGPNPDEPPEMDPPLEEDPGSCNVAGILDGFDYADQASAFAAWPED